jgi:hypothetical protein
VHDCVIGARRWERRGRLEHGRRGGGGAKREGEGDGHQRGRATVHGALEAAGRLPGKDKVGLSRLGVQAEGRR